MTTRTLSALCLFSLFVAAAGCSSAAGTSDTPTEHGDRGSTSQPIIGGKKAVDYPESALIDMYQDGQLVAACSGSVIAPRVVLTAGHCILGVNGWRVTTPFSGKQTTMSNDADTTYKGQGESVDPGSQDLGLIFLTQPITLSSYPALSAKKLTDGTQVVNIGRIDNGQFSSSYLSVGPAVPVTDGAGSGYPYDYSTQEIIESGDSGGPVMLTGPAPHTIVAVNSGAGGGEEVLARTDAVYDWIQKAIAAHGGEPGGTGGSGGAGQGGSSGAGGDPGTGAGGDPGAGAGGDPGAGAGGDPGTGAGGDPGTGGDPTGAGGDPGSAGSCSSSCNGPSENEPNDSVASAGTLGSAVCGSLGTADDQDWFSWSVSGGGVPYDVTVTGTDAEILLWKLVNGQYYAIKNESPQHITNTSNGAGTYFLAVWSPSGTVAPYRVARK